MRIGGSLWGSGDCKLAWSFLLRTAGIWPVSGAIRWDPYASLFARNRFASPSPSASAASTPSVQSYPARKTCSNVNSWAESMLADSGRHGRARGGSSNPIPSRPSPGVQALAPQQMAGCRLDQGDYRTAGLELQLADRSGGEANPEVRGAHAQFAEDLAAGRLERSDASFEHVAG